MTGDYLKDTVALSQNLKATIDLAPDSEGTETSKSEALDLITAYIALYRNRAAVNDSVSFTTMQTALNSLAGHYKNSKRPLPEKLKDRLNEELTKAEQIVVRDS